MEILKEVKEIFEKHELKPIELPNGYTNVYDYLRDNPKEVYRFETTKDDNFLNKKYKDFIPNGWYGFDIGTPIVPEWIEIIDEVLELCTRVDPELEIHQVKLKYGGIRFYVHTTFEDDIEIEFLIEDSLFDEALIY